MAIVSSHVDIPDVDVSEEEEEDDDHSVAPVYSRTRDNRDDRSLAPVSSQPRSVIHFSGGAGAVKWR
jgi:hypothetical protein